MCKVEKPSTEFGRRPSGRPQSRCKACNQLYLKGYYKKNPELHKSKTRAAWLKWQFGISVTDYENMFVNQDGACAICKGLNADGRRLHVDHCHETGRVRGLLCHSCNIALGLMKDDVERLEAAARYLKGT